MGAGQPHVFEQFVEDCGAGVVLAKKDGAAGRDIVGIERRYRRAPCCERSDLRRAQPVLIDGAGELGQTAPLRHPERLGPAGRLSPVERCADGVFACCKARQSNGFAEHRDGEVGVPALIKSRMYGYGLLVERTRLAGNADDGGVVLVLQNAEIGKADIHVERPVGIHVVLVEVHTPAQVAPAVPDRVVHGGLVGHLPLQYPLAAVADVCALRHAVSADFGVAANVVHQQRTLPRLQNLRLCDDILLRGENRIQPILGVDIVERLELLRNGLVHQVAKRGVVLLLQSAVVADDIRLRTRACL